MGEDNSPAIGQYYYGDYGAFSWTALPLYAKVLFQLMFVAASAHIVSGAVAERIKYFSFYRSLRVFLFCAISAASGYISLIRRSSL